MSLHGRTRLPRRPLRSCCGTRCRNGFASVSGLADARPLRSFYRSHRCLYSVKGAALGWQFDAQKCRRASSVKTVTSSTAIQLRGTGLARAISYFKSRFSVLSLYRPPISACKLPPRKLLISLEVTSWIVKRVTENREKKLGRIGYKNGQKYQNFIAQ